MTWLFAFLMRRGASVKVARWLTYAITILGAVLLLWGLGAAWLHFHDKRVRADDRASTAIEVLKGDVKANEKAAETRRDDDARLSTETRELEKATANANDPAIARQRYYDCVRVQQDARARGIPSPTC